MQAEKYTYFCRMYLTLFPDFFPIEADGTLDEAQRIDNALRTVALSALSSHAERGLVLKRLLREGITTAWHLLHAHRDEVMSWRGVGPVFLQHFDEMREELIHSPQQVIDRWHSEQASLCLPECVPLADEEQDEQTHQLRFVEQAFVELLSLLPSRWGQLGEGLRRFFLEATPIDHVLKIVGLSSRRSFYRLLNRRFLAPLLQGEALSGLSLSPLVLQYCRLLRENLLFQPMSVLHSLERMASHRFLLLLGFRTLSRSALEAQWACDFIVREGQIVQSRQLLHRVASFLQHSAYPLTIEAIQPCAINEVQLALLPQLLLHHPWVEQSAEGVSWLALHLPDEQVRLCRLLLEADVTLTSEQLVAAYEYRYLERPQEKAVQRVLLGMTQLRG